MENNLDLKLHSEAINLVVRQTNYDIEKSKQELIKYKFNYLELLKDYYGITQKQEESCNTANQERYRQIRNSMDVNEENYIRKKKQQEVLNNLNIKIKK